MADAAAPLGYAWAKHPKQGNRKVHPSDFAYWKGQGYEIVSDPDAMLKLEQGEAAKRGAE